MPFDFSTLKKKKPPMKSVSGMSSKFQRPSLGKGPSTKAADALASMGFGKGMKVKA